MVKINFKEIKIYKDIAWTKYEVVDMQDEVANAMYEKGQGIKFHALALKIYNAKGEIELDEQEYGLLMAYANQMGTPAVIDAFNALKNKES
jgi:hypothetical protein